MSWSRKKRTLCFRSSDRSSAKRSSSREASARLMLLSSAPMVAVSGATSMALEPTVNDGHAWRSTVESMAVMGFSLRWWGGWGSGLEDEDGGTDAATGLEI